MHRAEFKKVLESLAARVGLYAAAKVSAKAKAAGEIELAEITWQNGNCEITPKFEEWGEGIYLDQGEAVTFVPYQDIITMTATPIVN